MARYPTQPKEVAVSTALRRNSEMALLSGQMALLGEPPALPCEHLCSQILPLYTGTTLNLGDKRFV